MASGGEIGRLNTVGGAEEGHQILPFICHGPNTRHIQLDNNGDCSSSSGRVGWLYLKKVDESSDGSVSNNGDQQQGTFVTLNGYLDMELDKLLRASAYILGASGYTILYKAVLEDGLTFALRRLGDGGLERYKDFEAETKAIGRVKHPNIVNLRAFYWAIEEKLLVYDYIPHGSLANAYYGRTNGKTKAIMALAPKREKDLKKRIIITGMGVIITRNKS